MGEPLIEVGFFVDSGNSVYFLDFHEVVSKPFINANPLALEFTSTIILVGRYGSVHIGLFIDVCQLIVLDRVFLLGVRPFPTVLRPTDQRCTIYFSILSSNSILSLSCVHI